MSTRLVTNSVLVLLAALAFLPALGRRDFWSAAEGRPPLVALDMIEHGRFQPPFLLGEPYWNKPPLYHAEVALAFCATGGRSEAAARLPSALAAMATILLAAALARAQGGEATALSAGLFLLLGHLYSSQARSAELETTLTFGTTLATAALFGATFGPTPRRGRLAVLAALGGGIATLAKGPVLALLFPALAAIGFAAASRSLRPFRSTAALALLGGVLAASLAYYGPLLADASARAALATRASMENVKHDEPLWFYAAELPLALLPALLAVPFAFRHFRDSSPATRGFGLAALLGLVALSFSASKQDHYLMPILPWIAVGASEPLARRFEGGRKVVLAAIVALAAMVVATVIYDDRKNPERSAKAAMASFAPEIGTAPLGTLDLHPATVFYCGRRVVQPLGDPGAARAFLAANPTGFVIEEQDRDDPLRPELAELPVRARWRSPSGKQGWTLLGPGLGR